MSTPGCIGLPCEESLWRVVAVARAPLPGTMCRIQSPIVIRVAEPRGVSS